MVLFNLVGMSPNQIASVIPIVLSFFDIVDLNVGMPNISGRIGLFLSKHCCIDLQWNRFNIVLIFG